MGLFSPFGSAHRRPDRTLMRFAKEKRVVMVEVENVGIHFRTVLVVKGTKVVLARPKKLARRIPSDGFLRVYHADLPDTGFRLPVVSPHFRLTNGNSAIVTAMPTELVEASRRQMDRFDTSHLFGMLLTFPLQDRSYPVLDISRKGCRVLVESGQPIEELPPDVPIRGGTLVLGRPHVTLETVVPRVHVGNKVGCAFEVGRDSKSRSIYEHFLGKLEESHNARNQVDPAI